MGISEPFYYKLESGDRGLTEEYLTKLSDFYDVTTDYLIGRTKNPQGYILEGDNLPKELRDIDIEGVEILRDAHNSGISNKDIKEIVEFMKYKNGFKP